MEIQPTFPPHRRQDPRRCAEAIVYDQLARSGLPGHALYELKALPEAPELDFFAWFEDRARFGAQVKGGTYSVNRTVWTLQTVNRTEYVPCPLTHTWDAAIAVRDAVYRALGFKIFIIPVLLLPDTPPNQAIEKWATQRRVKVLFGADDLVDRLLELADRMDIKHPLPPTISGTRWMPSPTGWSCPLELGLPRSPSRKRPRISSPGRWSSATLIPSTST